MRAHLIQEFRPGKNRGGPGRVRTSSLVQYRESPLHILLLGKLPRDIEEMFGLVALRVGRPRLQVPLEPVQALERTDVTGVQLGGPSKPRPARTGVPGQLLHLTEQEVKVGVRRPQFDRAQHVHAGLLLFGDRLVTARLASRTYPEHAYRSCLGLLRLGKRTDEERLEAACRRALHFSISSNKGVRNILDNRLDEQPLDGAEQRELTLATHANVRRKTYYR